MSCPHHSGTPLVISPRPPSCALSFWSKSNPGASRASSKGLAGSEAGGSSKRRGMDSTTR